MRNPPSIHAVLPDNLHPLHPHRLPHPRQILRRLLHPVRSTKVAEIRPGAVARAQRARKASAADVRFRHRRDRDVLGLHLPLPEPIPEDPDARVPMGARGCAGRHVGLRRPEGRARTLPLQHQSCY